MENRIIVAAHGTYAQGVKSAVELISGPHENITYLSMYLDNTKDYEKEVENLLKQCCDEENVIVLSDLSGGSVNRMFMMKLHQYHFHLVSGFNLGIVLELALKNELITHDDLTGLLKDPGVSAVYCNDLLKTLEEE